jgi:hypothetical protein
MGEIGVKVRTFLTTPIFFLCLFLLISQICNAIFFANGIEPSIRFQTIYNIGFYLIIASWYKNDCQNYQEPWLIDSGLFVYLFWFLILPFHLFKTRGIKAILTILIFIGIYLSTYLISLIVYQLVIALKNQ